MPPNADQSHLRQRFPAEKTFPINDDSLIRSDDISRVDSIHNLKDTEVAIDGVIYDLKGFNHPGGNSFLAFGGNDVTVMYHMIHPLHNSNHLKKLTKVGRVSDWKPEYVLYLTILFYLQRRYIVLSIFILLTDMILTQSLHKKLKEKFSRLLREEMNLVPLVSFVELYSMYSL